MNNTFQKQKKRNGFTLVELLVVVGIFVFILTFTVFNYVKTRETNNLRSAAQQFINDLNYARDLTLNGIKNQACLDDASIADEMLCSQYTVILKYDDDNPSTNNSSIYALAVEGFNNGGNSYSQVIAEKKLPSGIQFNDQTYDPDYNFIKYKYINGSGNSAIKIAVELQNQNSGFPASNYCVENNGRRPLLQENWLCVLSESEKDTPCDNASSKINIHIDCNGRGDIE